MYFEYSVFEIDLKTEIMIRRLYEKLLCKQN